MITKQDARDFVNELANKRKSEINAQIAAFHEAHTAVLVDMVLTEKLGDLVTHGMAVMDIYDNGLAKWAFDSGAFTHYNYYDDLSDTRKLTEDAFTHMTSMLLPKVITAVEKSTDAPDFKDEVLDSSVAELQKSEELQGLLKARSGVNTLRKELLAVVNAERSGKVGLERVKSLGLDTSSFIEKTSANFPAIIKLSADVSLLNGSC